MTRITEQQLRRTLVSDLRQNREFVNRYSAELSSGYAVSVPGDSNVSGTVAQFREALDKIAGYKQRISTVTSVLSLQDEVTSQANEVLIRAKEIATQAASETNDPANRAQLANEVWQLRDQLASLANTQYQGRYIYGCADDDDPPYDPQTYAVPATGSASTRYAFDNESGTSDTRSVKITDDLTITVNTPADELFGNAMSALERLGRALDGYDTLPASGAPDGSGAAFNLPGDFAAQTAAIQNAINLLDTARTTDIMPERVALGGKLKRLDGAMSVLEMSETNAKSVLARLQDADYAESASNLTQAQTALQASYTVTTRVLSLSILDYL